MRKFTTALFLVSILVWSIIGVCFTPLTAQQLNLIGEDGSSLATLSAFETNKHWFVDLHDFFRALNFDVTWRDSQKRLDAQSDNTEMRFQPETDRVLVGDRQLAMVEAPRLRDGRLFMNAQALANLINRHTSQSLIWNSTRNQLQLATPAAWAQDDAEDPLGSFIQEIPDVKDEQLLVVIDPGHGGRDPGAIGHQGTHEKDVVLDISLRIRDYFKANHPKLKVRLTRTTDKFIPLSQRTQIANDLDGDVFLSIHANSNRSSQARGFDVYTLSGEATSPTGEDLAEIENSALRYEGFDENELDDVSWILYQLENSVHVRESREIAKFIMDAAEDKLPIPTRRARQAPFWVLKDARMPAMLVETGFLSNPDEEQTLQLVSYQNSVAEVLGQALETYRKNRMR